VRGFTGNPRRSHELREYINEYLTDMSTISRQYRGRLEKFIAGAVGVLGAPVDDAPRNACLRLEMQRERGS